MRGRSRMTMTIDPRIPPARRARGGSCDPNARRVRGVYDYTWYIPCVFVFFRGVVLVTMAVVLYALCPSSFFFLLLYSTKCELACLFDRFVCFLPGLSGQVGLSVVLGFLSFLGLIVMQDITARHFLQLSFTWPQVWCMMS